MSIKRRVTLTLIIFIAADAAIIYFAAAPFFFQIKGASMRLAAQIDKTYELENKIKNLDKLEASRKRYQEYSEKIDALFVDAEEPISFIEFLEKEAMIGRLSIEITPLVSRQFQIALKGSFPDFVRYIEKMESAPYLIEISNLNISKEAASFLIKAYPK
jgi:hypothetical protein